ncbi:MAG: hypothetical protein U0V87_09300 [Acidobacteriota bacterium]
MHLSSSWLRTIVAAPFFVLWVSSLQAAEEIRKLDVPPIFQRADQWGYLAVSEMVLRHYGLPPAGSNETYQCGIASLFMPKAEAAACRSECLQCAIKPGTSSDIESTVEQFPSRVGAVLGLPTTQLIAIDRPTPLELPALITRLDAGKPVIATILGDRAVLIVGYRSGRNPMVLFNDPDPGAAVLYKAFDAEPGPVAGGWWVEYDVLRNRLGWSNTVTVAPSGALGANASPGLQQPTPQPAAAPTELAQRCCVQSALGPSSCPSVGGPYPLGTQCACQIGSMSPILSGQICSGR